ncbi:serine/threonine-protein kinase mos isoform X1 [Microplitis mediator]|uniref:serine/threonine-protein kinase mos isoform X1 n=1 Tax=Microplitis mediator TaxID=375433 RepID=UPI0025531A01|nr:serine/threonine-protein kinase mos isoform X1 [Microplitis mediator]XP_057326821.1 serine/threonine-protein kinase mos isoform X1 [Microplitis mediator]XP_057326895.1 serine/threonine-protein kinase mos isoform X1 [Microplitis mediator]XP_057326969.1 serine/threonine-protein kinase mos isoform X1 [Microplitis mediator]XP_057327049.1 serine/threonine-protein kinase mos isoform X1 [Microplitis mediator]
MASPRLAISTLSHRNLSPHLVRNLFSPSPRKLEKTSPSLSKNNHEKIYKKNRILPFSIDTPNRKKIINDNLPNEKKVLLGCGGFGIVYKALYKGNQVAVKIVKRKNIHDAQVEAEKLASFLQHPNIIKIISIEQGSIWSLITMELCDMSLQDKLDNVILTRIERIEMWKAIASALEFCHNAGIVHADVKPKNILITSDGHPKLSDFGSSIIIGKSIKPISFRGTPGYVAPEVIKGCTPMVESDIYSLGIIAWQMLSRKLPFLNDHSHTILYLTGKGVRPADNDIDDECHGHYKNLYQQMWSDNAIARPNLENIIFQLSYLLKKKLRFTNNLLKKT